ncbi:D-alanyl-D-alanine carboxypeptidase [Amycolatopsis arida]|uniref:D-alanyl-D-alanine carboxypeptidase n=1 Tax=Amycolatopsis arida TaxID=587909 RepID=A0A1I5PZL8_9PSEU|nr:serine hydrolase domain-containing protein [Amycolatopsis arida]TDX98664.1 D-alanyl-D-alanine carboxypeptidase [Amycolatopsis arida]SFP39455.1 D-alanyl-D-alanine carboxypeptidase [Amycolatopsis arida]
MRARRVRRLVAGALALAVGVSCVTAGTVAAEPRGGHADTKAIVDGFVEQGVPGAMVFARDRHGSWTVTSGTRKLGTHRPIRPWDRARVASNTKMFVAAVVLQLVGEGRVGLDAPIEEYLPGLVRGNGYDGHEITVRQLLQHTSGMADYVRDVLTDPSAGDRVWRPEELVRLGLSHPPLFPPGTGWQYSNTGYIVLGMLVEAVTGNGVGTEITDRLIRPHGLWQTTYPDVGQKRIRGPHVRGYHAFPGMPIADVTDFEPSIAGAAGALVSTGPDLTRFVRALVSGKVLRPDLLAEMRSTVPAGGGAYGLGIREYSLPCGGVAWGHGGNMPGFDSFTATTDDGRSAFAVANGHRAAGGPADLRKAVESALC